MESTGKRGCIHISQETADEITISGKSAWIKDRSDKVTAKGKGELTTFWLSLTDHSSSGDAHSESASARMEASTAGESDTGSAVNAEDRKSSYHATRKSAADLSGKSKRLIEWNVDILLRLLAQIAKHQAIANNTNLLGRARSISKHTGVESAKPEMVLDEVSEVIQLPKFSSKIASAVEQTDDIELHSDVKVQLHEFVSEIAGMYHDNPFHNFEHASHVTMSVVKLLSRIVAPDLDLPEGEESALSSERKRNRYLAAKLHDHTYGITSDPLTQFAVVFSALVHDVDHTGVPNNQLIKEDPDLGKRFRNESVAEQHSVAASWDLLMQPKYQHLRRAIYRTDVERERFLQLVVNCVMATDIVNPQLKELRNARWDKAFKVGASADDHGINRKATIVIEHLIQASDVSHTMQHWHIYRKWVRLFDVAYESEVPLASVSHRSTTGYLLAFPQNERLFREMYSAYRDGRAEKNPAEFWAKGEVGFFDFYIVSAASVASADAYLF